MDYCRSTRRRRWNSRGGIMIELSIGLPVATLLLAMSFDLLFTLREHIRLVEVTRQAGGAIAKYAPVGGNAAARATDLCRFARAAAADLLVSTRGIQASYEITNVNLNEGAALAGVGVVPGARIAFTSTAHRRAFSIASIFTPRSASTVVFLNGVNPVEEPCQS